MNNGGEQSERSIAPVENTGNQGGTSGVTSADVEFVDPLATAQEERGRVFGKVEHVMDAFRRGDCTPFQTSVSILNELNKWTGVSDQDRGRAYISYLKEINPTTTNEARSNTREATPPYGNGSAR